MKLGYKCEEKRFEWSQYEEEEDKEESLSREFLTEREVGKLMNSINDDPRFTMESESDFENKRLPTIL